MALSLVDVVVVAGIAGVAPLALGGRRLTWWLAAGSAAASFFVAEGWAAVLVAPFALVALATLAAEVRRAGPPPGWRLAEAVAVLARGYALVAAFALIQSRAGAVMFGVGEPIVELTAVHFLYAGTGALTLAGAALGGAATRGWPRLGVAAVVLTGGAPPVVALGFTTGSAVPQVGGAVLMTLGVWCTAVVQLRQAGAAQGPTRVLLRISGLAVWIPMVLAVAWAASLYGDVPALSIPDMARTHGVANAVGFVGCGLVARRRELDPNRRPRAGEAMPKEWRRNTARPRS